MKFFSGLCKYSSSLHLSY
uniref:Uncharacterized protein n=1 Tax=Anguilla anguilla TaxID=7936 RepID=A0A0E9PRN0_ANGAN